MEYTVTEIIIAIVINILVIFYVFQESNKYYDSPKQKDKRWESNEPWEGSGHV